MLQQPKVIFLDAVGTLFGVKGSVGDIYSQMAQRFDVSVPPTTLNKAFIKSFKTSPPPLFPDTPPVDIPQREFDWWQNIVLQTFREAGVLDQFPQFFLFFTELYHHFATATPWFVYPDVLPALKEWQKLNIQLGIISNFDSRLYPVLQALELSEFFTSVTVSTQVGIAKPDPQIFDLSLKKHRCSAGAAWHIGDSIKEDYEAARAAGLRGIWVNRA